MCIYIIYICVYIYISVYRGFLVKISVHRGFSSATFDYGLVNGDPIGVAVWWYTYPSDKYEFVSWDYEVPNIRKKNETCSKLPTGYVLYV